jgi:hypothetical protein
MSHCVAGPRLVVQQGGVVVRRILVTLFVSVAAALAVSASTAAGQDVSPKLTIAAGGGIATPFHVDFDFTAPSWELSARAAIARHAAVEGFFEQWEHSEGNVAVDQVIHGPSGILGRVARVEQRTTYRMRTAGFHVLGTGGSGRVSFFGGGGIGLLVYDRRYTSTTTGCDAGTAALCRTFENTFSSNPFTVQGVAEVDVTIVPRVQAFGRYLLVVPLEDPGFGHGTVMAGARIVLW